MAAQNNHLKRGTYKREQYAQAALLFRQGLSIRRVTAIVGVVKATATKWRRLAFNGEDVRCPCGLPVRHQQWCDYRISLSKNRQAWLAACVAQSAETKGRRDAERAIRAMEREERRLARELEMKNRPRGQRVRRVAVEPVTVAYPYFHKGGESNDLVLQVNEAVPKYLPYQIRADVCQELLLAILNNEITETDILTCLPKYVSRVLNQQQDRWKEIPIDAPIHFQDGDAHTLADCMSAEDYADRLKNAWEANRLLTPRSKTYGTKASASRKSDLRDSTATMQVVGIGRRKMSSRIRHAGHGRLRAYSKSRLAADQKYFAVQDYREQRINQDRAELAEVS